MEPELNWLQEGLRVNILLAASDMFSKTLFEAAYKESFEI